MARRNFGNFARLWLSFGNRSGMGDDLLAQDSQSEAALALRLAGKTPSRARDALWQRNAHQAPCHERLAVRGLGGERVAWQWLTRRLVAWQRALS